MFIKQQDNNHYLCIDNIRLKLSNRLASNSNALPSSNFQSLLNDRKDSSQTNNWSSSIIANQSEAKHPFTDKTIVSVVPKIKLEQRGMYHHPERRFSQESKHMPLLSPFCHSTNQRKQSVTNLHDWQFVLHIDRMKAKQRYDCFPEHIYNTAFGSLLTGLNCIDQTVGIGGDEPYADNEQYSQHISGKIPRQIDDRFMSSTQICNNSAWNDDDGDLQQQSLGSMYCQHISHFNNQSEDIIKILVDFLSEFLLFLSSIIEREQFNSQFQLQKMVDVAERIHQLRSTILTQINNINEHMINSAILDIPSISLILHELACFIHSLSNEQQQIETIIDHPQMITFTQLLDRLEKIIESCTDNICLNGNSQTFPTLIPTTVPCMNPPDINDKSSSSIDCLFPCIMSNTCIPWSLLEQMKNLSQMDNLFGLMYGIKDETIRKKMGYRVRGHKSSNRMKQRKREYKPNHFSNEKSNFDGNSEWTTGSTSDQMLVVQQSPAASMIEQSELMTQTAKSRSRLANSHGLSPLSISSIMSKKKNQTNRLGSNRNLSPQQSLVNSKQPSMVFSSNSDDDEPTLLRSIQDRLLASDDNRHMSTDVRSPLSGELPITSMLDHSGTQHTPSRLDQEQQSNIYNEGDHKNTSPSTLSFQTYAYPTPSKKTYKMSRENSQNLSPVHSKSLLSRTNLSNKDVKNQKTPSNFAQSDKGSSDQKLNPYNTHTDNVDSSVILAPNGRLKHDETLSSKSWEQRLASPLSMTSIRRSNSTSLKQNIISPISSRKLQSESEFNFDDYSEFQTSPSRSFHLNETNGNYIQRKRHTSHMISIGLGNVSPLTVIEGPQSAEGSSILEQTTIPQQNQLDLNAVTTQRSNTSFNLDSPRNVSDKNKTALVSSTNRHRQRSASATSDSEDSQLLTRNGKQGNGRHLSRTITRKQHTFYGPKATNILLQSNKQGYFNKFMNCVRRTMVNRVDRLEYKNK